MPRKLTGKIANLSKEWRDVVNLMLMDGATYQQIIERLKEPCPDLVEQNITNWFQGGYQEWLKEQTRLADMKLRREQAERLATENKGSQVHEASLQIASSMIYDVLTNFDAETLKEKLQQKPEHVAPLINALAKLSDQGLKFQRYQEQIADRKRAIEKELSAARGEGGLTKETLSRIEEELKLL